MKAEGKVQNPALTSLQALVLPGSQGVENWGTLNFLKTAGVGEGTPASLAGWVLLHANTAREPSPEVAVTGQD